MPLKLGIVGCGAVTENLHLPAMMESTKVEVTALMDPNQDRVEALGKKFNVKNRFTDLERIQDYCEVAILALPHHLHAPTAVFLLEKGIHVFVEKPVATNMKDANQINDTAKRFNRKAGVGLIRRQYSSSMFVKEILEKGWIGEIVSFDIREGGVYNWPAVSDTLFKKNTGGGVLFDTGAHTLDMLLWWLGDFSDVKYYEDSDGGVESNCELHLILQSGATGIVELSRTRNLRNSMIISGKNGVIEVGTGPDGPVMLKTNKTHLSGIPVWPNGEEELFLDIGRRQIDSFADAITHDSNSFVSAQDAIKSVRLFEACKKDAKKLPQPWVDGLDQMQALKELDGKKICVLGGTGFIGGGLVELLAKLTSAELRVLVRNFSRVSFISRFDLQMVHGDVTDRSAVSKAISGCDIVFNCTYGKGDKKDQKVVNVDSVRMLMEEAKKHAVNRVVHVSTVSVYGNVRSGVLEESTRSRTRRSDVYALTKLKGEKTVLELGRRLGVPSCVIQPTIVYGPDAPSWTVGPLNKLKTGQIILIEGGKGLCNAVYVDDVVSSMMLAATKEEALGQTFLISGEAPVTWPQFYAAYEQMLGFTSTINIPLDRLRRLVRKEKLRRLFGSPFFRKLHYFGQPFIPRNFNKQLKTFVSGHSASTASLPDQDVKPIQMVTTRDVKFLNSSAKVSIDKAKSMLGYRPNYDIKKGMSVTSKWAHWADML